MTSKRMKKFNMRMRNFHKIRTKGKSSTATFPDCIGKFPECKEYKPEMLITERAECQKCPFREHDDNDEE